MLRVALKLLVAAAAVAAVWAFVPFGGRSLQDRWSASSGPGDFAGRTWADMKGVPQRPRTAAKPQARGPAGRDRAGDRPAEAHSDQDRRALDRIVSEHLRE